MIHPHDANNLRCLLLLEDGAEIPEPIESAYDAVARIVRRARPGPIGLDLIVASLLHAGQLPVAPPKVSNEFAVGDEVEVLHGDDWQPAKVLSSGKNGVRVRIESDESPFRYIKPQNIRALQTA